MTKNKMSFNDHVAAWFRERAGEYYYYGEASPQIVESFAEASGSGLRRDPDRAIRGLCSKGVLEKHPTKKGFYRWANTDQFKSTSSFSLFMQEEIIAKNGLLCKLCSSDLQPDEACVAPIVDFSKGGQPILSNGQVLCKRDYILLLLTRDPKGAKKALEEIFKILHEEKSGIENVRFALMEQIIKFMEDRGYTLAEIVKFK
jgi:hypothetical protein